MFNSFMIHTSVNFPSFHSGKLSLSPKRFTLVTMSLHTNDYFLRKLDEEVVKYLSI